jgi:hypothetical protein
MTVIRNVTIAFAPLEETPLDRMAFHSLRIEHGIQLNDFIIGSGQGGKLKAIRHQVNGRHMTAPQSCLVSLKRQQYRYPVDNLGSTGQRRSFGHRSKSPRPTSPELLKQSLRLWTGF